MDKFFYILRMNDLRKWEKVLSYHIPVFSAAARDNDFAALTSILHRMKDNVLLQYAVVAEGCLAGFENVKSAQFKLV